MLWRATSPFGPSLIQSNLVFDSAGRLYGTSLYGGAHGLARSFERPATAITVLITVLSD